MDRRSFLQTLVGVGGALVLPYEPERVYSFARDLRVPGVAEFDGSWHLHAITWDGKTARCLVDGQIVAESNRAPIGGAFFEYDSHDGQWRGRFGDVAMPESSLLLVERGDAVVDFIHGVRVAGQMPAMSLSTQVRFLSRDARFKLGWGSRGV